MKRTAIALAVLLACALHADDGLVSVQVPAGQAAACADRTCALVPAAVVYEAIASAYRRGKAEAEQDAAESLDSNGCKKGKT